MEKIEIRRAEPGTELWDRLIRFVEESSWEDVKAHTARLLKNNEFTDWEAVFAALDGDEIVGHATLTKTDYYPLPEIFPWISTVFVAESHRGHRISGLLIDALNEYARSLGFRKTYIPSEHTGLYEKYGYKYVRDIVNYAGGTDRLYEKEIATDPEADFRVGEILDMQRALQEEYREWWEPICPETGKNKLLWMVGEIGEVADVVKKHGDREACSDPALRSHLVEELADVLMYYGDVLLCFGVTPRELKDAYTKKFHRNMSRWKD